MKLDNFLINDYLVSGEWKSAIDAVAAYFNMVPPKKSPVYVTEAQSENRLIIYSARSTYIWINGIGFVRRIHSYSTTGSSHINIWAPVKEPRWFLL